MRKSDEDISQPRPSKKRRTVGQFGPCPECDATQWDQDDNRGEVHCTVCGYVSEENVIDTRPEWIHKPGYEDQSRVGAPSTMALSDKGLNTTIDRRDLRGERARRHGIRGSGLRDWNRRAVIDERSKTRASGQRSLVKALQMIRDRGKLPSSLVEVAALMYRKAAKKGIVTGRSIAGVSAACTYLAAREAQLPRPIEEIAEAFLVNEKELRRTIRLVSRHLGTHRVNSPAEYLDPFGSKLGLPPIAIGRAMEMWEQLGHAEEWQGKKPAGVAGMLLYLASQESGHTRTQADVCEISGISEVTLRGLLRIHKIVSGLFGKTMK